MGDLRLERRLLRSPSSEWVVVFVGIRIQAISAVVRRLRCLAWP
jgi:hypothetical protein